MPSFSTKHHKTYAKALLLGLGLLLAFSASVGLAWAQAQEATPPSLLSQTEALVGHCKTTTALDRMSGITASTIEGQEHYADCLQGLAVRLAHTYYPPEAFGPEGFETQLTKLLDNMVTLYGPVHNSASHCQGMCGTMYYAFPAAEASRFLEHLIVDMAERCQDSVADFEVTDAWVRAIQGEE